MHERPAIWPQNSCNLVALTNVSGHNVTPRRHPHRREGGECMLRENEQLHIDLAGFDDSPHRPHLNRRRGMLILGLFLLVAVILVVAKYRQSFRDTLSLQFGQEQTTSGKVTESRED